MDKLKTFLPWGLAAFIAVVFVTSLFSKFTGAPEGVHIFSTIEEWTGLPFEPAGRFGVGIAELIASILLLVPATRVVGALGSLGIISGAIFFHLFSPLGVVVTPPTNPAGDGGGLFMTAVAVWLASAALILLDREKTPAWVPLLGVKS